jgi:hypothetical protein
MTNFVEMDIRDLQNDVNGGGIISGLAGGVAGALIGTFIGLVPAAISGDPSCIAKGAIAGATAGVYLAAVPLP